MTELIGSEGLLKKETERTVKSNAPRRIIYAEPNDTSGRINDVPLTPDYTDYCVSFDLIVDVVSRMRSNSSTIEKNNVDDKGETATKTYVISWSSRLANNEDNKDIPNEVSFMSGERYGKRDYLTTYYVDNHYNDFKNKTIVEGLGVESVTISFESYYAPTVKMRFIDVRGASIFGREEVLHKDEVLSEDNIWGCFFTFPYPKYRLQVKGFYGKAVTYQLCCTDFRANFNPQTGNYEIDMSFLGYDFGLLADIPIQYLIAVPSCEYADTMAFWEKNVVANEDWKMSDGREPRTFKYIRDAIYDRINNIKNEDEDKASTEEIETLIVDGERQSAMDEIKLSLNSILTVNESLQTQTNSTGNQNVRENNLGLLGDYLQNTNEEATQREFLDKTRKYRETLQKLYNDYKGKWPDSIIGKTDFTFFSPTSEQIFSVSALYTKTIQDAELLKQSLDGDYETLSTIKTENISESKENTEKQYIQDIVGFLPNIGNVFRTLFCHLETFVHMIYQCVRNIEAQINNGERTLEKLGLPSYSYTDIYLKNGEMRPIDPFPAVYQFEKTNEDNQTGQEEGDDVKVDAWIGEVRAESSQPWEEEILIEELFKAVLRVKNTSEQDGVAFSPSSYPVIPSDLNHQRVSTALAISDDSSDLAGYLALRAVTMFGLSNFTSEEAMDAGKAEAFHYYEIRGSKLGIKDRLLKSLTGDKSDYLLNLMLCKGSEAVNNKLTFEMEPNLKSVAGYNIAPDRQPFFVPSNQRNGVLNYVYTEDKNGTDYIPLRVSDWGSIKDVLSVNGGSTPGSSYYGFKLNSKKSNVLYKRNSRTVLNTVTDLADEDKRSYSNDELFTVYYGNEYGDGSDVVSKVEEIKDSLKNGSVTLNGYTADEDGNRFKKLLANHWLNIDDVSFRSNYLGTISPLYPSTDALGLNYDNGINQETGDFPSKDKVLDYKKIINGRSFGYSNGDFRSGDITTENEEDMWPIYPSLQFMYNGKQQESVNIFTSDIYYMQNDHSYFGNDPLTYDSRETASESAKALLFLLTMNLGKRTIPSFMKNIGTAKIEGVPLAKVLLYGGLLWRRRFYMVNNIDPIQYRFHGNPAWASYKPVEQQSIPMYEISGKIFRGFIDNHVNDVKYLTLESFIGQLPDFNTINILIKHFQDFVKSEWKTISDNCELKTVEKNRLTSKSIEDLKNQMPGGIENAMKTVCGPNEYKDKFYCLVPSLNGRYIFSIFRTTNQAMDTIRKLVLAKVIVQKTVQSFNENGSISINRSDLKNFLSGFITQLEEIANSETTNTITTPKDFEESKNDNDIKRLMYMFIKNLWDRWFSCHREEEFTVSEYMKNTLFIDSMYRNVYTHIHINCEILMDLLDESDGQAMVFKFLSDITTKHHCMFFALPDHLDLGGTDEKKTRETMESLFTPFPYSQISKVETQNRYIVMFTHKPSEINDTRNGYEYDSFDIYSHDEDKESILGTFKKDPMQGVEGTSTHDIQCTRYGYNLPAFGVEFGRQNNAIFKRVNVGMQNPIQTDQSINALSLIAQRGRGNNERHTIFYGQDLYSVYSGYSYITTVEMMGNAQMMPLMYFQLFNVPMFRGAYMIYSVTHTLRPGDMTTTVKAMKMSKKTLPWCQEWYGDYYFRDDGSVYRMDRDDECSANMLNSSPLGPEQRQSPSEIQNVHNQNTLRNSVGKNTYKSLTKGMQNYVESNLVSLEVTVKSLNGGNIRKWIIVNKELRNDIIAIFNDIYETDYKFDPSQFYRYPQHGEKSLKSFGIAGNPTVIGCYEFRNTNSGGPSNHAYGCAVDINPTYNPMLSANDGKEDSEIYIRTKNHPVVKAFAKHGWGWGGSDGDFMHFSPFYGS